MKVNKSNLKVPILLPLLICLFVIFKMQTLLAARDTKKPFPIISKKCSPDLFCHSKDSILYVSKKIPIYDFADGQIVDEIKYIYIRVLGFQLHTYSDRKTKVWLHVKTADRKKFWILQNSDDLHTAEPLSEEDIESLKNNTWDGKIKKLTEAELLKKIKTETFSLNADFSVQKLFNDKYPVFKQGRIYFSKDMLSDPNSTFVFENCSALKKILQEKMDYETVGTDFQVRYNRLFIENEKKLVTESFAERCQELVDENSAICPTSGNYFETLVSKVGSLVSIEYGEMTSGGCGPVYTSALFKSIDLKTRKEAQLTDFFEEADLVKALQQDSIVQAKFEKEKIEDQITLEKLTKAFNIYGFAIYEEKIRNGRLRIRIAIGASDLHFRGYTLIGVDVKPKKDFLAEFKSLDPNKELFLAKTAKSLSALEGSNAD